MPQLTTIVPTTELDAVNRLLRVIGEAPITDVDTATQGDVAVAVDTLRAVLIEFQTRGWKFNWDFQYRIAQTSNKFDVPSDLLKFKVTYRSDQYGPVPEKQEDGTFTDEFFDHIDLVVRDDSGTRRFYDRVRNKFDFGDATNRPQIFIDYVRAMDFEDMPETARKYVVSRAAVVFAEEILGANDVPQMIRDDEAVSWILVKEDQGHDEKISLLDNISVSRALGGRPRYGVI